MRSNPLHKAIIEKFDAGYTHQQVYDELVIESGDKNALARLLMRVPDKATFDATKIFRTILPVLAFVHVLLGVYFLYIINDSLSNPYLLWTRFGLFSISMLVVFGFAIRKKNQVQFIMLLIPIMYFGNLNDIIPPQFLAFHITNLILFLLLFITEVVYAFKLKRGIVLNKDLNS
ncbi:MAG: hypothetical protein ABI723_16410 [Bacteroidia bacterium]